MAEDVEGTRRQESQPGRRRLEYGRLSLAWNRTGLLTPRARARDQSDGPDRALVDGCNRPPYASGLQIEIRGYPSRRPWPATGQYPGRLGPAPRRRTTVRGAPAASRRSVDGRRERLLGRRVQSLTPGFEALDFRDHFLAGAVADLLAALVLRYGIARFFHRQGQAVPR